MMHESGTTAVRYDKTRAELTPEYEGVTVGGSASAGY